MTNFAKINHLGMYGIIIGMMLFLNVSFPILLAQKPQSAEGIIHSMHQKYQGKWYPLLTFTQKTLFYQNDSLLREQTWFEAGSFPNRLIIKIGSMEGGEGILFAQDSQFVFRAGKLQGGQPRVHDLLELGFNVYFQAPEISIAKLKKNGYDFSKFYEKRFKGRKIWVIGAENEQDQESPQFWIDQKKLWFVKMSRLNLQKTLDEIYFVDYTKIGKYWISPHVLFYKDKKLWMEEIYRDIQFPEELNPAIFDPDKFKEARW